MIRRHTVRAITTAALTSASMLLGSACLAQHRQATRPEPEPAQRREGAMGAHGEHLAQWMNQHAGLTPEQQQTALEREPGFHDLPTQTQQRMRERLSQLDSMPPAQRSRVIQRTEAMERLTPDQRGEVRHAMSQLSDLPPERRHAVERTFRSMRLLTPQQQSVYLQNPAVRGAFSEREFVALNSLIGVSPLLPHTAPSQAPPATEAGGH